MTEPSAPVGGTSRFPQTPSTGPLSGQAAAPPTYEPVGFTPELAAKNVRLGVALFVLALLIAGAAVAISFIYLHFD